jgi:hypothetical protein
MNTFGLIILAIICLMFAPFMTIGYVIIENTDSFAGDFIGCVFFLFGFIRMLGKIFN